MFAVAWVGYSGWIALTLAVPTPPADRTPLSLVGGAVGFLSVGLGAWPVTGHAEPRWLGGGLAVAAVGNLPGTLR